MPIIASFFGITIRMYYSDHPPPHFHAQYQGFEALVRISEPEVIEGGLPRRASALVKAWCMEH